MLDKVKFLGKMHVFRQSSTDGISICRFALRSSPRKSFVKSINPPKPLSNGGRNEWINVHWVDSDLLLECKNVRCAFDLRKFTNVKLLLPKGPVYSHPDPFCAEEGMLKGGGAGGFVL